MSTARRTRTDIVCDDDESEELYSVEYLKECASGTAREERLEELRRVPPLRHPGAVLRGDAVVAGRE